MFNVGDQIKIINMQGEPQYNGKIGRITHIDDYGHLHGTWGGCSIIPAFDTCTNVSLKTIKDFYGNIYVNLKDLYAFLEECCGEDIAKPFPKSIEKRLLNFIERKK